MGEKGGESEGMRRRTFERGCPFFGVSAAVEGTEEGGDPKNSATRRAEERGRWGAKERNEKTYIY